MTKRILGLERPERLWLIWVLVHAAVWFVGMGLGGTLVFFVNGLLGYAIPFVVTVVAGGAAEWLILRKRTRVSVWWVPATALGWLIGISLVIAAGSALESALVALLAVPGAMPFSKAVSFAVGAAALGTAQWLILRKHVRQSGWWVLASAAGFAAGGIPGFLAIFVLGFCDAPYEAVWGAGPLFAAFGVVYGAITALALVLLLRRPIEQRGRGETAPDTVAPGDREQQEQQTG